MKSLADVLFIKDLTVDGGIVIKVNDLFLLSVNYDRDHTVGIVLISDNCKAFTNKGELCG